MSQSASAEPDGRQRQEMKFLHVVRRIRPWTVADWIGSRWIGSDEAGSDHIWLDRIGLDCSCELSETGKTSGDEIAKSRVKPNV